MADHTGIDENDIPQTPGLTPHVQSVHNLVQAWKVCVMHCNGLLAAITHYVHPNPYAEASQNSLTGLLTS